MNGAVIYVMSPSQVREVREKLGQMWGLGRMCSASELADALGLAGKSAALTVLKWEKDQSTPSAPVSRLMQALVMGFRPEALPFRPERRLRLPAPPDAA